MDFFRNLFKKFTDHFVPSPRNVYRPHMLRKPWLVFFLAVILTAEGVFVADLLTRQSAYNFLAAVLPGEVVALTNEERTANNVEQLHENPTLKQAAQAKAEDMASKGYFAHTGPDGKEPWAWVQEAGYSYQAAGENLAVRFADSSDVVNAWMASPTHRANIVKPVYQEIGVGVAQGTFQGEPATYVVQYFATPLAMGTELVQPLAVIPPASSTAQVQGAELEAAASSSAAQPMVAPAQTESAPPQPAAASNPEKSVTPWSSFARELVRGDVQPSVGVLWVLGAIASLLVVGLALAFFIHIQVQATDMLVGGAVVAVMALSFLALNYKTPFLANQNQQAAAVFGALPTTGGFIDSSAFSTEPR